MDNRSKHDKKDSKLKPKKASAIIKSGTFKMFHSINPSVKHSTTPHHQASVSQTSEDSGRQQWNNEDLMEPQYYPDPVVFRATLEKMTKDDEELKKNLTSNKATLRVLAPYLKSIQKDQKKLFETAIKSKPFKSKPIKTLSGKKTKEQISPLGPDIADKYELICSIHETADILKTLVKANSVVSYLVKPAANQLFQIPRHTTQSTNKLTYDIQTGGTMATFAALNKSHVISDNVHTDTRFQWGLGFSSTMVKYAMCVPIKTPEDTVVAVYELSRDAFHTAFDKKDLQVVIALTVWMGVAIHQNNLYTFLAKKSELIDYLIELTDHCHAGTVNNDKALSDIVVFARETIGAERCSLFVLDKESNKGTYLVDEYDHGLDMNARLLYKRRTKRTVQRDDSILSKVLFRRETVNKHDIIYEIGLEVEPEIRSLLCVPIKFGDRTIGATQLMNKKTAVKFDKEDETILQIFATFCSINLNHLFIHNKLRDSELHNDVTREMLFHHIKPCKHDQETMSRRKLESLPKDFFTFAWYPSPDQYPRLAELTVNMFQEVLGASFMAANNVPKFVLTVQNCYRPNPYHNFIHAFSVSHAMANILTRYQRIFTGLEKKGLMVASLCHDLDHRGYTNNFITLTKHYLSSLYETSPLENHHFAVTKMLLQQCGMFRYIKPKLYNELLAEVYELIIATDLSLYFQNRMELVKVFDEKTFDFKTSSHRRLVKGIMMTVCDLSGQTKPLSICKNITEDVYEEFFQQGDIEKGLGFVPLPTMDRDKKDMMAENQVQFLSVVVIPCVEMISRIFSELNPMMWDTKNLLRQWKELIEIKEEDCWSPEQSLAHTA